MRNDEGKLTMLVLITVPVFAMIAFAALLAIRGNDPNNTDSNGFKHVATVYFPSGGIELRDFEIRADGKLKGHKSYDNQPITVHPPFTLVERR